MFRKIDYFYNRLAMASPVLVRILIIKMKEDWCFILGPVPFKIFAIAITGNSVSI